MQKTSSTSIKRRDVATLVARIHGVSDNYVRKVLRGERENEAIFSTYMEIIEQDNLLIEAVRKAVPL
jgi:hypothetical protein